MDAVRRNGGTRTPSSSQRKKDRRVDDSPSEEQDGDSEAEPMLTEHRRTPKSNSKTLSSFHNNLTSENDENENPALDATPASSKSIHGKRRRLSTSGRSAAIATPTQSRQAEETDEDEDEDEDEATPPPPEASGSGTQGASSRIGLEDQVDPVAAEELAQVKEEHTKTAIKKQLLVRDRDDGYVMGSIVRIKCHNFLTYFDIECYPGPHLNMIFGPNGSGKSSLVAAIALGLGFPTKVMARTKALSRYVKEGTTAGFVEIELKGRPGKRNLTVKRSFSIKNDQSVFEINGKVSSKADVESQVAKLHVNVNNLCTFLPQDRVSDFAKMTGDQLLRETQRTADATLLKFQDQLTEWRNELGILDKSIAKNKISLVEQERKMNSLERDVRRHRERQEVEDRLAVEAVCLPYAQYAEAKSAHEQAKREKNQLKTRMDELADDNAPLMQQRNSIKALLREAESRRKALVRKRDEITRTQRQTVGRVAEIENRVEHLRNEIKEVKEQEASRKKKLDECKKNIRDLEKACENPPPEEASVEVGQRSRELREEIQAIREQMMELRSQYELHTRAIDEANTDMKRAAEQLKALNDVQMRRLDQCKREDPHLYTAIDWVRRNQRHLKGPVYEPIRILISVKDKRYARVAENAINWNVMKTMVCLERDDYNMLSDTFTKFKANDRPDANIIDLRVNLAELPANKRDLAQYERPCTQHQLEGLGFDAFVLDLLEGPPDVLAYLCLTSNVHRIPVTLGDGRSLAHDRLRQSNSPFRRYITHNTVTDINFSKYGNRGAIVQDMPTKEPQSLAESVDQNRKRELELRCAEAETAKQKAQQERDRLTETDAHLNTEGQRLGDEKKSLDAERQRIEDAKKKFKILTTKLKDSRSTLARLQQQPGADARRRELAQEMKKLTLQRLQAAASLQALENTLNTRSEEQTAIKQAFEEITRKITEYRNVAKEIFGQAEEGARQLPDRLAEQFQERVGNLMGETADSISSRIEDLKSELELSQQINSGVIQKYEDLKTSVEKLQNDIEHQEGSISGARQQIDHVHAEWYPRVKDIVETVGRKFSAAMASLGCLGEVSIKEDEDYAKWAISIKVAFRDGENLAELTSHRQSGGERSLTTMMYLISLLQMSKAPFSLVDEINQGMDARAERAVHNHLVKAVCEVPDVGQYFLLTPKLLTNLNYHANIKILCVNNGEWLPDDGLPIRKLITKRLQAKRVGVASVVA